MPAMHPLIITITAVSLAIAAGCSATPARPRAAQQDPLAQEGYPAITVQSSLRDGVVVDYARIVFDEPTSVTPAAVQVPLRSNTRYGLNIQYQFSWYDADGRFVRDSGWKFVRLPSGQERALAANAIDDRSTAYRLEIRPAR